MIRKICRAATSPSPVVLWSPKMRVSALLAAEIKTVAQHLVDYILVAHRSAHHLSAGLFDGRIQTSIAHHRRHHRLLRERALGQ